MGIYMLKVNSKKTKTRYEICSKLTIKIQEQRHCCWSGAFSVNFEHTSQLVLEYLLLTLNRQIKWQKQWHNGKTSGWLHSKCFFIIVPEYHKQGKWLKYICKLTVIFFLSYMHSIIRALYSIAKPQAFSDSKILVLGASLSRNKFFAIPGDLVNEETINREVIVRGGPMNGGYSTSIDAEDDFILNSHILVKVKKEFKNKMNFKTDSNFKASTPGENRKHKEQKATFFMKQREIWQQVLKYLVI